MKKLISFTLTRSVIKGFDSGEANGYVAIPKSHPCYGMNYDDIHDKYEIDVHGGLTYSGDSIVNQPKKTKGMWIIGFDTAHYGDNSVLWSIYNVKNEAERLRKQLESIDQRAQMLEIEDSL